MIVRMINLLMQLEVLCLLKLKERERERESVSERERDAGYIEHHHKFKLVVQPP